MTAYEAGKSPRHDYWIHVSGGRVIAGQKLCLNCGKIVSRFANCLHATTQGDSGEYWIPDTNPEPTHAQT